MATRGMEGGREGEGGANGKVSLVVSCKWFTISKEEGEKWKSVLLLNDGSRSPPQLPCQYIFISTK